MPLNILFNGEKSLLRVPSGSWKPGDLNSICPGLEIVWNLPKKYEQPGQNKKFSRKPG